MMTLAFSLHGLKFLACNGYREGLRMSFKASDLKDADPEDIVAVCRWVAEHENELTLIQDAMDLCPGRDPRETQILLGKLAALQITEHVLVNHYQDAIDSVLSILAYELDRMMGDSTKDSEVKTGYVYLLHSGPFYKIGVSTNVSRRLRQLRTLPPFDIELVCAIVSENRYELERELHTRFADKRVNGEWFELEPDDVAYIKGLAP